MPIAIHLAAAALSASPLVARPLLSTPPPITVSVSTPASVSPRLATALLNEAGDIWRDAGITFIWRCNGSETAPYSPGSENNHRAPSMLHVSVVDEHGQPTPEGMPLGWIVFNDAGVPGDEIFVSHANARLLLGRAAGAFGAIDRMPLREQETYLGRALGRALAHELGHYLLASKAHTQHGLMQGRRSSAEFFRGDRDRFRIAPAQQQSITARLMMLSPLARNTVPLKAILIPA